MKKIILIGAGGHCVSCIDVIEMQRKFKIVGLIDNKKKYLDKSDVIDQMYWNENDYKMKRIGRKDKNLKSKLKQL